MTKKGMSPKKAVEIRLKKGIGEGTKLRRARVKRGLSQTELSELAGVSLKTLQRFEQSNGIIDGAKLSTLCNLCIALGCKIADIIDGEELISKYRKAK